MMLRPADLLVLDEPTNDLDIPTLEVLEDSLLEFPGALVLVTHDRHLLDRVSTTILALDGRGGVERFAESAQWAAATRRSGAPARTRPQDSPRRARRSTPRKLSYLERQEFDGMEAAILEAEERLEDARARAEDPAVATDAGALEARLADLETARSEVARLYARWAELEAKKVAAAGTDRDRPEDDATSSNSPVRS
jgi:ATP-binding cassette subfamily F protein uup